MQHLVLEGMLAGQDRMAHLEVGQASGLQEGQRDCGCYPSWDNSGALGGIWAPPLTVTS